MWQPVLYGGPCSLLHRAAPWEGDLGKVYGFGIRGRVGGWATIGEAELWTLPWGVSKTGREAELWYSQPSSRGVPGAPKAELQRPWRRGGVW